MTSADAQAPEQTPGFGERGRMRRRARFLRKAHELALRDLGGLVFDMHRFGQQTSDALTAKLSTLRQIDAELRALDHALGERRGVTVLQEVGIAACPRCAAIHGRDDRFCPGCGLAFDSHADRPVSTSPVSIPSPPPPSAPGQGEQAKAAPDAAPDAQGLTPEGVRPVLTPPPPIESTAVPVAARPPEEKPTAERPTEKPEADGHGDQPTEILRPPVGGG